ncbi:DUF4416 family protein [Thermodesulfovibrionales bacterium]|nr:DUF4416 family protein [Thermodesulfovibrionales bacterium]
MGIPRPPDRALLFVGVLFSKKDYYIKARQAIEKIFGEIIMEGPAIKWDFSDHYKGEIGEPLYKRFIFLRKLVEQENLSTIKLLTNKIEENLSIDGKRNVNLDPGYLTLAKIVLASTKDYAHRVYLRNGIYADLTLLFREGQFVPHINTYKDYQDERHLSVFMIARKLFNFV